MPPPPHPRPRPRTPIALSPLPSTAFLSFILRHHAPPTTLIICSTRDAFLQELHSAIVSDSARHRPRHHHPTSANSSNDDDDDDEPPPSSHNNNNNNPAPFPTPPPPTPPPTHPLLTPTIHLIAKSRSVTLAFTPTLPHLRAYIAAYTPTPNAPPPTSPPPTQTPPPPAKTAPTAPTPIAKTSPPANTKHNPKSRSHYPILAIWRLATLHRSTAEHSAQGLSRTLAAAVESAEMGGVRLVLGEGEGDGDGDGGVVGGVQDGDDENEDEGGEGGGRGIGGGDGGGLDAWMEQVPVLSGSVRFGGDERVWAGRTVEVGRVVGRWCRFVRVGEGDGEGG